MHDEYQIILYKVFQDLSYYFHNSFLLIRDDFDKYKNEDLYRFINIFML